MRIRIRDMREDYDKTQKQIAEYLHCNQSLYSKYERGERDIPLRIMVELCKYYETSVDYLVGLTMKSSSIDAANTTKAMVIMNGLKELRKLKNLTQEQISEFTEIDQSDYSKIELGKRHLTFEQCKRLAVALDTSMDYLAELTDNPIPYERKK